MQSSWGRRFVSSIATIAYAVVFIAISAMALANADIRAAGSSGGTQPPHRYANNDV
jgi:hypothetical protein